MAAAAAKAAALAAQHAQHVEEETESTGVMRLLVVSMALNDDKVKVHNPDNNPDWTDKNDDNAKKKAQGELLSLEEALAPDAKHYDHFHGKSFASFVDRLIAAEETALAARFDALHASTSALDGAAALGEIEEEGEEEGEGLELMSQAELEAQLDKDKRDWAWRSPNGYQFQEAYDAEFIRIRDEFFGPTVFGTVDIDKREDSAQANTYVLKNAKGYVVVENASGDPQQLARGLWYGGPVRATRYGLWDDAQWAEMQAEQQKRIEAGEDASELCPYDPDQIQYIWDYEAERKVYYLPAADKLKYSEVKRELAEQLDKAKKLEAIQQKFKAFEVELAKLQDATQARRQILPPWAMCCDGDNKYGELERWMYEGTGEVVAMSVTKSRKWKLQPETQRDLEGPLALTDREKRCLREAFQLNKKKMRGESLNQKELLVEDEVFKVVEFGPCHNVSAGVHHLRVKSLVKQMKHKCVFWTNTEDELPGGSVQANTLDYTIEDNDKQAWELAQNRQAKNSKTVYPKGAGNEVFEFWKYGKLIGSVRKRYILSDRQRLLDAIEQLTPTYKGMIKRQGEPGHEISETNMQLCVNCCAFALDTTLPEMQEDRVALYIKMHIEMILGPTWHVIVGRNFGFCITAEARHFVVLRIRHLEVMIWKHDPDPNTGKKQVEEG